MSAKPCNLWMGVCKGFWRWHSHNAPGTAFVDGPQTSFNLINPLQCLSIRIIPPPTPPQPSTTFF